MCHVELVASHAFCLGEGQSQFCSSSLAKGRITLFLQHNPVHRFLYQVNLCVRACVCALCVVCAVWLLVYQLYGLKQSNQLEH